jgi:Mn-dependent DtxR family transcriptional regulator
LKELRNIKKLLVLWLSKNKVTNVEMARSLGVNESAVRKMLKPEEE